MAEETRNKDCDFQAAYAALAIVRGFYYLAYLTKNRFKLVKTDIKAKAGVNSVIAGLGRTIRQEKAKIVALALCGLEKQEILGRHLWLKLDIVPHFFPQPRTRRPDALKAACWQVQSGYGENHKVRVKMTDKRQVIPSVLTDLAAYEKFTTLAELKDMERLTKAFKEKKLKMFFVNATAAGGGVAHMRHAMIRLYRLLGLDIDWLVLKPSAKAFNITKKKFHNVLQAVAPASCRLTAEDRDYYLKWNRKNARFFKDYFSQADVAVVDDPQPAGLIPYIKKANPRIAILYRSHIQVCADLIDRREKQQFDTWKFLWQFIKLADRFVSHPVPAFVPQTVKRKKLVYAPPSTDPLDGLNKKLSIGQKSFYWSIFNRHLRQDGQEPIDPKRPYLIQIARFDPSKGIYDVIESYRTLRTRLKKKRLPLAKTPQLVITGNGSVDDPEGLAILQETKNILELDVFKNIANDIKVARLPHFDQLLNTLLSDCLIALQLSHKEGFEFKVTEALMKGKPVIAYRTGGIPLQIRHSKTGFLTKPGNTRQVAEYAEKLISDRGYYKKISRAAAASINHDYWTWNNCKKWLELALENKKQ